VESPATSDLDDDDNGPADATKSVAVAR